MLTSLSSAVSGLDSFQQQMDVIGNNIANINTTGFKAGIVQSADSFSDTLASATANSEQLGTGVYNEAITNNWTAGAITSTGVSSDLAISGNGYFVVQDATTKTQYLTQDGAFSVDPSGNLVTAGGQQLMGNTTPGSSSSTVGALQITAAAAIAAGAAATNASTGAANTVSSYTISSNGNINITMSDATTWTTGQVMLQNVNDPQALVSQSGNLYTNQAGAGPLAAAVAPGTSGTGTLQAGALEESNVDLSQEMANLIIAQRGFEANSKIVTTSDQLLQTMVNLKQG